MDLLRPLARAERPAILRIGITAYQGLYNYRRRATMRSVHRQPENRFSPVGICSVLHKPLKPSFADALYDVAQATNAMALVGVGYKVVGPLNALLQLWNMSYRNSFGHMTHSVHLLATQQLIVGFSPAADALSVDSVIRNKCLLPKKYSRAYGGVPTAVNLAATAMYLISGVAKVRSDYGWGWAGGTALREQVAADAIRKEVLGGEAGRLAQPIYQAKDAVGLLGVGALAIELGAPLALTNRKLGQAFALAAWAMHWGIATVMGIKFKYNMSGIPYLGYFPIGPVVAKQK
ncbi:hypothetical protein QP027_01300 [Corynebacterium breve]|uniref:HTTM domain-containing protein n=1 Tax=Corynebacterium breve TaxID=3049799 RepID=A0ABY8VHE6_9CORY|nr:hypothetical protein [Corynebacterium breve]WIM68063.1 hypothetical protein QP027_01300 [Corynebacterium breve]